MAVLPKNRGLRELKGQTGTTQGISICLSVSLPAIDTGRVAGAFTLRVPKISQHSVEAKKINIWAYTGYLPNFSEVLQHSND
jgi:hypothetical protein